MKKFILLFSIIGAVVIGVSIYLIYTYINLGRGGYNPPYQYVLDTVEYKGLKTTITNVEYYDDSTTVYFTFENTTRKQKEINIFLFSDSKGNKINSDLDIKNIFIDGKNTKYVEAKTTSYAVVYLPYCFKIDETFKTDSKIQLNDGYCYLYEEEDWNKLYQQFLENNKK